MSAMLQSYPLKMFSLGSQIQYLESVSMHSKHLGRMLFQSVTFVQVAAEQVTSRYLPEAILRLQRDTEHRVEENHMVSLP